MRRLTVLTLFMAACSAPSVEGSAWMEHEAMRVARSEHPAAVLDGEIVVLGGFVVSGLGRVSVTPSVEAYDPAEDVWRDLPELPEPRHHLMAAVVDQALFALGGYAESGEATNSVWELVDDSWVARASIPEPVGAGAAVELDGSLYLVGGTPNGGFHRYDPARDAWETLPSPSSREHLAAVSHAGEVWAIGGRWQGTAFDTTEVFSVEEAVWREGPRLLDARSGFGATVVDDTIVLGGGEVFDPLMALTSVEALRDGSWVPAVDLPFGLHGNPLVSAGGRVYLPGGSTRPGGVDNPGTMMSLGDIAGE